MYAFAQRRDTLVFDEPLYASYLAANPRKTRPYRDELLRVDETNASCVIRDTLLGASIPSWFLTEGRPSPTVRFYKHIASQLPPGLSADLAFRQNCQHFFLIRHPYRVVASYWKTHGEVSVEDTGLWKMNEMYQALASDAVAGSPPPLVLDNSDLLDAPEQALKLVCNRFGLEFQHSMLRWPPGGHKADGIWAEYWYAGTHKSQGFEREGVAGAGASRLEDEEDVLLALPPHVQHEAKLCLPLYEEMRRHRSTIII